MFERFTDGARQATVGSQEEARARGADGIAPSHLVLALLRLHEDPGMAASLGTLVPSIPALYAEVDEVVPRTPRGPAVNIPFTAASQEVFARAAALAKGLEVRHIGTEHLLLAVVGGADPTAAVFARAGADRDALLAAMRGRSESSGFAVRTTRGRGRFRRSSGPDA